MGRCLAALRRIDLPAADFEVIIVDDCSSDGTYELLENELRTSNWRLLRLEANSGSPSKPRNEGIDAARGDYIFFIDCDDEILPDTLRVYLEHARRTNADIVRGYLIAEDRDGRKEMNRLLDWSDEMHRTDRIRTIISKQSTIPCSLIRRAHLLRHTIRWRHDIRMGEDTLFLIDVLISAQRIEYIDHPTYVYIKTVSLTPSSTQSYGNRELRDHLEVWSEASLKLLPMGIDYVALRLQVGLAAALNAMIFFNRGDITDDTLLSLSAFLRGRWETISNFNLSSRMRELVGHLNSGDLPAFRAACRPRLLIAGFELKFIAGLVPELSRRFDVRLDVWKGHDAHDEPASRAALQWAELIWCEWMLGNAVWYSRHKSPQQRLIVRMHRFELGRDFGDKIDERNVDAFVAVSTLFFERMLERFPNIPRSKARLLHNYVDARAYRKSDDHDRRFRLAMIGILPARKGFGRALSILNRLREQDERYTLDVLGYSIQDTPWLAKHAEEVAYFEDCGATISRLGLGDAVRFRGHSNVLQSLADFGIGIVLSTSESVRMFPCFESFHLAVADGFAAGGVSLIQYWEGAEYIWPAHFILPTEEAMVDRILSYRDQEALFLRDAESGNQFVNARYGRERFTESFKNLFQQVR